MKRNLVLETADTRVSVHRGSDLTSAGEVVVSHMYTGWVFFGGMCVGGEWNRKYLGALYSVTGLALGFFRSVLN